jgi:hypothetical protein
MIRCLVERVVVHVRCDSEFVDVTIHWAGGYESQHEIIRPVGTYAQLRDFDRLMDRVVALREAGHNAPEIAEQLDKEGFYPPKGRGRFTNPIIYQLLKRRGLIGNERMHNELLGRHEWWLTDLAPRAANEPSETARLGQARLGTWSSNARARLQDFMGGQG